MHYIFLRNWVTNILAVSIQFQNSVKITSNKYRYCPLKTTSYADLHSFLGFFISRNSMRTSFLIHILHLCEIWNQAVPFHQMTPLLCVSRLRGSRRQQRGMGPLKAVPQPQPQAQSHSLNQCRQEALQPRTLSQKMELPALARSSRSHRLWTPISQRQVSLCVCQPHLLSVHSVSHVANVEGDMQEKPVIALWYTLVQEVRGTL